MSEIYTDPPQSRNEAIIKATIDGTEYTAPPQSRMEDLLLELKEVIEHGGGGGTSDYPDLTHKPQVNGVTLVGNKTSADLGLMDHYDVDERPTESSENLISSKAVWEADKNIEGKLQGSKTAGSTDGSPFEIPDYGMTESIQMYFKPTQDLHGYDKPWAGGAGKNKWNGAIKNGYIYNGTYYESNDYWCNDGNIPVNPNTTYIFSGVVGSGQICCYDANNQYTGDKFTTVSEAFTTPSNCAYISIYNPISTASNDKQLEQGSTATSYEPYSNICPISGQDNATFSWTDDEDIETEVTMNFGNTYYGGFCQFNGSIYPDWDYIASYNGETLSGEWVSDRDEYTAGTTPTIGAEVAYKTTPSYVRVTPPANLNLTDDYPIEYNGYMASIYYQPKNTVLAEAKRYTNQEIAKLGLPQPPTIDGTYHLECSVSSGIPTITWVSNS